MEKKYVKDKAHNRYPAYCCDDIDERVGALEEAVAALVAGTVPDGSVTLAKLAEDARSWAREINRGTLVCEWIGTQEEYDEHVAENGGKPLANCRYTITDYGLEPYAIGSFIAVRSESVYLGDAGFVIGNERELYLAIDSTGTPMKAHAEIGRRVYPDISESDYIQLEGMWRCCGETATREASDGTWHYALYQRVT